MSPWTDHVAEYRKTHGCTLKEAMVAAKSTYVRKEGSKPRPPRSQESKDKAAIRRAEKKLAALKVKATTPVVIETVNAVCASE